MSKRSKRLSSSALLVLDLIAKGRTYEQILSLNPVLTYLDIFDAASEALAIGAEADNTYSLTVDRARGDHPRAYYPWTGEEEATLTALARSGMSHREIAGQLHRQPSAVRSRLVRLGPLGDSEESEPSAP